MGRTSSKEGADRGKLMELHVIPQPMPLRLPSPNTPVGAWDDFQVIDDWESSPGDYEGSGLAGAVYAALSSDHVLLPVFYGGVKAARAALRLMSGMLAALAGTALAGVALNLDAIAACTITATISAWVCIELECAAQHMLRRRRTAECIVSTFDPTDFIDCASDATFDMNTTFDWSLTEEAEDEVDCGNNADNPPMSMAEMLVQDFGQLAPGGPAVPGSVPITPPGTAALPFCTSSAPRRLPPLSKLPRGRSSSSNGIDNAQVVESVPPAPAFPPPVVSGRPVAKDAGDALPLVAPVTMRIVGKNQTDPTSSRPNTGISDKSLVTVKTAASSSAVSSARTCTTSSSKSSRSIVSVLSVSRNGPSVQVKQPCDLEALKLRYIQSITSKKVGDGDTRLDQDSMNFAPNVNEGLQPNLVITHSSLLASFVAWLVSLGLCFAFADGGARSGQRSLSLMFLEAFVGWATTVLILDLPVVLIISVMRWHTVQNRLAERRDHRWRCIGQQRAQKAETMRAAATKNDVILEAPADEDV